MMLDSELQPDDDILQQRAAHFDGEVGVWELLLRETHHRMENTLTTLAASVRLDFDTGSPKLSSAVDRFERRVVAFGRLYHLLSSSAVRQAITVADFFESLCEAEMEAILQPAGIHCELVVEDSTLRGAECSRLGLIVSELVANAAKHAFPSGSEGLIRVEVLKRDNRVLCTVADNGVGMTGSVPGTGRRLVDSLARSIRAEVHSRTCHQGTAVTIVLPATYSERRDNV